MKKSILILLCLFISIALITACSSDVDTSPLNITIGSDSEPGTGTVTGTGASPEPEVAGEPAIVFNDTIEDPMVAIMAGSADVEGTATLELILYETSPGVYSGDGTIKRDTEMRPQGGGGYFIKSTSRLFFENIKPGEPVLVNVLTYADGNTELPVGGDSSYGVWKVRPLYTSCMPTEYTITVDGNTAKLNFDNDISYSFTGEVTQAAPFTPNTDMIDGRCIAVNSTYMQTGQEYNHESRCMLTATQASGLEYTGNICVYGAGTGRQYTDEDVRFTLAPFDGQAYKAAGGSQPGSFDAFAVIETSVSTFILLLYSDLVMIEATDGEELFHGELIPANEADAAKKKADDTKPFMKHFYDNPDPSRFNEVETATMYWMGKPPWYPDWIMPKPANLLYWLWTESDNIHETFLTYKTNYDDLVEFEEIYDSYCRHFSEYEGYEAYWPENVWTANIYFHQGAYSFWVNLQAHPGGTTVVVWIT